MCGIAGIFRFNNKPVPFNEVKSLTDSIVHRGPDAEGIWINKTNNLGLGHRRLSILDLSSNGDQPMHFANNQFSIVYNGEIFNFKELRNELIAKGYSFHTETDTEVLLAAYHAWGKDCLYKLNGFWAFAIWDDTKKELWLARDRFGIKPLHYLYQPGEQFVFGSETLQFKNIEGYTRTADLPMLVYNIQNCWGIEGFGKTIFKDINQIRPGYHMVVKASGEIAERQWWRTSDQLVEVPGSYDDQVERFQELLQDSIRLRLRSDVSLATALSGGLDSSTVFSQVNEIASKGKEIYRLPDDWQKAFIAVFPGTDQDEKVYADKVLDFLHAKGVYVDCRQHSDLAAQITTNIKQHDCINASPELILDRLYGAMKGQGITVSMDGHGVDEMLFGYAFNVLNAYGHYRNDKVLGPALKNIYLEMTHADDRNSFERSQMIHNRIWNYLSQRGRYLTPDFLRKEEGWFNQNHSRPSNLPYPEIPLNLGKAEAQLYHDFHFTTLPTILRNFDRGAMSNGVEIRMPFLDYRIVTYVFSLPIESKIGNGFTKRILRDAMKGKLPEDIRTRKLKTGFNAPLKNWLQNELREFILDEVSSTAFLQNDIWDGHKVRKFVLKHNKDKSWTMQDTFKFWPVFNAHLLFQK